MTVASLGPGRRVLEVEGLSKHFGANEVLIDVDLIVERGQTVCILGPSGSGKSTLLRCINWLEVPDRGQVLLEGRRVGYRSDGRTRMADRELSSIRTTIGMVFQHFALWPHLSVIDNLMVAPLHVQHRPKAEVREEATALLAKVGLYEKRDEFPARLSGGQKQRVGIARALAMRPPLLLFDEPTSSLDPELVGEVLRVMNQLAADGMTMLVVTHEMEFARDVADHVVLLDHGRIVEASGPEQFFSGPATDRGRQFLSRYATAARWQPAGVQWELGVRH